MAVYRPKSHGGRSKFYLCEFVYQGKRFRESTSATTKTLAKVYEQKRKAELERAALGLPTKQEKAHHLQTVDKVSEAYLKGYRLAHRPNVVVYAETCLKRVKGHLGKCILADLTEERIREYICKRQGKGISGRTINMELAELSRAVGKTWRELWPKVRKLEERKDVGKSAIAGRTRQVARRGEEQPIATSPDVRSAIAPHRHAP